jgi:hypothetical protein
MPLKTKKTSFDTTVQSYSNRPPRKHTPAADKVEELVNLPCFGGAQ